MANFSYKIDEGRMDQVLSNLSKEISSSDAWKINRPTAQVYEEALKKRISEGNSVRPLRPWNGKYSPYVPNRSKLMNSVGINKEKGGAAKVGVTRKSKQAYIARFLNDGWTPRNQHGGPYAPVPGEHFFEGALNDSEDLIKKTELEELNKYFYYKAEGKNYR